MQDIPIVIKDKKSLKNLMRKEGRESKACVAVPRVVHSTRSHQTVTDTERLQERKVRRGGKVRDTEDRFRDFISGMIFRFCLRK